MSEVSNPGEPLPALGTADKRVSCLPLLEASSSGEPLQALFPNSGEPLLSPQSEETVSIQQHLQATDPENLDIHVKEYIIQEHNDKEVSSDGTVAWEHKICHLHHFVSLLTTLLACQYSPTKSYMQRKSHSPRYTGIKFSPSPSSTFPHRTCYTSSTQSARARPPRTKTASLHTHTHAHKHYQASTRRLLNTGVSLCFGSDMLSSRSMHALHTRRSRVQPYRHTFTVAMPPTN